MFITDLNSIFGKNRVETTRPHPIAFAILHLADSTAQRLKEHNLSFPMPYSKAESDAMCYKFRFIVVHPVRREGEVDG